MSNQSDRQASFRAIGGTTGTLQEDMLAAFAADTPAVNTGTFNERFFIWLGQRGMSASTLPGRMTEFAVSKGAINWDSLGTFTI